MAVPATGPARPVISRKNAGNISAGELQAGQTRDRIHVEVDFQPRAPQKESTQSNGVSSCRCKVRSMFPGLASPLPAGMSPILAHKATSPRKAPAPSGEIFSLGKVRYEMASGLDRFQFPDSASLQSGHPQRLRLRPPTSFPNRRRASCGIWKTCCRKQLPTRHSEASVRIPAYGPRSVFRLRDRPGWTAVSWMRSGRRGAGK
jgi:hypothetical protein